MKTCRKTHVLERHELPIHSPNGKKVERLSAELGARDAACEGQARAIAALKDDKRRLLGRVSELQVHR